VDAVTRVDVHVLKAASPSSLSLTIEVLEMANRLRLDEGGARPFEIAFSGGGAAAARDFLGVAYPDGRRDAPDVLVMPGPRPTEGDGFDAEDSGVRLAAAAAAGAQLATSGAGAFLLAQAGLLDGRRATTSWWLEAAFRRRFPAVDLRPSGLVVDGPITTAGAPLAQLDLMLSLVARHAGGALAELCSRRLLMADQPSPARFMAATFLAASDERVAAAERWAVERLEDSFAVEDLADAAGLTSRTFARRLHRATGLSPVRFVQQLRVRRALDLLRTTRLPFDEIARRVGYSEPSTLRRLFRREGAAGAREIRGAAMAG
jgi:transcriptional regulator GlxA family with amidase domain